MRFATTVVLLLCALSVAGFSGWRGARPFDPRRGPRLLPWRLIMVTAAVVVLVVLTHLVNLLGFKTGR